MTSRRLYRTDLSDARWALIEPILSAWRAARAEAGLGLSAPVHDLREIVNAILHVNRTGIAWEYLPHDFPLSGRARNSAIPALARPGSSLFPVPAAAYSCSNSSAQAWHICASGRNG
jgi:Putative transposase of IS4/5 family (DUF4096)